jgi:hypothetical protein
MNSMVIILLLAGSQQCVLLTIFTLSSAVISTRYLSQVPDWVNSRINGESALSVIKDEEWFRNEFTPVVATRGGALIKKWGRSSAASTAVSIADAIRALVQPTPEGDCFSSGVISDGNPYGVPEGIVYSFPLRSKGDGNWEFVRLLSDITSVCRSKCGVFSGMPWHRAGVGSAGLELWTSFLSPATVLC